MRYLVPLVLGVLVVAGCGYKLCLEACAKIKGTAVGCAEACAVVREDKEAVK